MLLNTLQKLYNNIKIIYIQLYKRVHVIYQPSAVYKERRYNYAHAVFVKLNILNILCF